MAILFPVAPQTGSNLVIEFSPRINNFPGQIETQAKRDFLPSQTGKKNVKLYVDDISTLEEWISLVSYYPFEYDSKNYILENYSITYTGDNKGFINMSLMLYKNPEV